MSHPLLTASGATHATRVATLADAMWSGPQASPLETIDPRDMVTTYGTAERADLIDYLAGLRPNEIAVLFALVAVGSNRESCPVTIADRWTRTYEAAVDCYTAPAMEAERLVLLMPLGDRLRNGIRILAGLVA